MGYKPIAGKLPDLPLTKCRSRTSAGDLRHFVELRPRERPAPCAATTDEKHPSVLEQRALCQETRKQNVARVGNRS